MSKQKHSGRDDRRSSGRSHDGRYNVGESISASARVADDRNENRRRAESEDARPLALEPAANDWQRSDRGYPIRLLYAAATKRTGRSVSGLKTPSLNRQIRAVRIMRDIVLASEHCPLTGNIYSSSARALWRELDAAYKTLEALKTEYAGVISSSAME